MLYDPWIQLTAPKPQETLKKWGQDDFKRQKSAVIAYCL